MSACAIKGCTNSFRKTKIKGLMVKYFTFPKDTEFAEEWRKLCRDGINITNARICSEHFEPWCYDKPAQQVVLNYSPLRGRKLRADAIPTLYLEMEKSIELQELVQFDTKKITPETIQESISDIQSTRLVTTQPCQPVNSQMILEDNTHVVLYKASRIKMKNIDSTQELKSIPNMISESIAEEVISTSPIDYAMIIKNLQMKIVNMKKAFVQFNKLRKKREKQNMEQHTRNVLTQVFTPGQIEVLMNPIKNRVIWSSEDITNALSLHRVSPKAYRYLRDVLKFPLPSISTLRRCTATIKTAEKSFP
ncbi:THAP domain-containing protein 2 [Solenopsis invicta]|uniref:THAP domain-containing protein 2 n=1 Tax=Solenopsis invicta TaxID=13686 RepID=UPI00193D56AD|nr:THAP domain-containing protein 2 [Solenopsis invicta]